MLGESTKDGKSRTRGCFPNDPLWNNKESWNTK